MRYIKEILKKNRIWVLVYIGLGIFNAFMANYKADYFQKVIDGLADRTLAFAGVATYGFILLVNYCMNYLDNYPEKKLEHGIYLDFKLLSLRKISTIDYTEYQKIGTGKLVQRIENGSSAVLLGLPVANCFAAVPSHDTVLEPTLVIVAVESFNETVKLTFLWANGNTSVIINSLLAFGPVTL